MFLKNEYKNFSKSRMKTDDVANMDVLYITIHVI